MKDLNCNLALLGEQYTHMFKLDTHLSWPKHIACLGKIWVMRPSDNTSN